MNVAALCPHPKNKPEAKLKSHELSFDGGEKDAVKLDATAQACAGREAISVKEASTIKEGPDLHWSKNRDALGVRAHPVKLVTYEQKIPKELTKIAKMWFRGTRVHPKWAVELSSVLHVVLALES